MGLTARHGDDRRCGSHCCHSGHDTLEAMKQRRRMAWLLIRLIEEIFVYLRHSEYWFAEMFVPLRLRPQI